MGAANPFPPLVFCPLLKKSSGNPYLKTFPPPHTKKNSMYQKFTILKDVSKKAQRKTLQWGKGTTKNLLKQVCTEKYKRLFCLLFPVSFVAWSGTFSTTNTAAPKKNRVSNPNPGIIRTTNSDPD